MIGVTGFIAERVDGAALATSSACALNRERHREASEERFLSHRVALDSVRIYREVSERRASRLDGMHHWRAADSLART